MVALFTLLENIYFSFGNLFLALRKAIYTMSISVVVEVSFFIILLLGLLGMGAVFVCATTLTRWLYGSLAEVITPVLHLLALSFPLTFLAVFFSSSLQALHQETKALAALAVSTGSGFLAACALIPLLGAEGAAYARVFSALIQVGWLSRYLWHLFSQPISSAPDRGGMEADLSHQARA